MYMRLRATEDKQLQKKRERSLQRPKEEEEQRIRACLDSTTACSG